MFSKQRGAINLVLLAAIALIIAAIPATTRMVQEEQEMRKLASVDAPCKVCNEEGECDPVASPPMCSHSFNECTNKSQCPQPTATPKPQPTTTPATGKPTGEPKPKPTATPPATSKPTAIPQLEHECLTPDDCGSKPGLCNPQCEGWPRKCFWTECPKATPTPSPTPSPRQALIPMPTKEFSCADYGGVCVDSSQCDAGGIINGSCRDSSGLAVCCRPNYVISPSPTPTPTPAIECHPSIKGIAPCADFDFPDCYPEITLFSKYYRQNGALIEADFPNYYLDSGCTLNPGFDSRYLKKWCQDQCPVPQCPPCVKSSTINCGELGSLYCHEAKMQLYWPQTVINGKCVLTPGGDHYEDPQCTVPLRSGVEIEMWCNVECLKLTKVTISEWQNVGCEADCRIGQMAQERVHIEDGKEYTDKRCVDHPGCMPYSPKPVYWCTQTRVDNKGIHKSGGKCYQCVIAGFAFGLTVVEVPCPNR